MLTEMLKVGIKEAQEIEVALFSAETVRHVLLYLGVVIVPSQQRFTDSESELYGTINTFNMESHKRRQKDKYIQTLY